MIPSKFKYSIDQDTGLAADSGPFRSYQLCAVGNDFQSLLHDAYIFEINPDGDEMRGYPLAEARSDVQVVAEKMLMDLVDGKKTA